MGDDDDTTRFTRNKRLAREYLKAERADAAQNCGHRDGKRCKVNGGSCQDAIHGLTDCPLSRMK